MTIVIIVVTINRVLDDQREYNFTLDNYLLGSFVKI